MASYGFQIVAAWEATTDGHVEFLYLLEWPDEATMTAQWAGFMADDEWAALKRDTGARHARMVGAIEDRVLAPVPYVTDRIGHG